MKNTYKVSVQNDLTSDEMKDMIKVVFSVHIGTVITSSLNRRYEKVSYTSLRFRIDVR